jgi:tRNA threonylcarbamoyladenosine biosynthesis protein TsaE
VDVNKYQSSLAKKTPDPVTFHAQNEGDTAALGKALAEALPDGAVVALIGTLGAGKTRLVQAIAAASGVDPAEVVSPTFVLVHEYHGRRPIYHFDAYRLNTADEFLALGPEEYFDGAGLSLVEWADRVVDCLPAERVEVQIDVMGPTERRFSIRATGERFEGAIGRLAGQSSFRRGEPGGDVG